jgi:hypothetical protein
VNRFSYLFPILDFNQQPLKDSWTSVYTPKYLNSSFQQSLNHEINYYLHLAKSYASHFSNLSPTHGSNCGHLGDPWTFVCTRKYHTTPFSTSTWIMKLITDSTSLKAMHITSRTSLPLLILISSYWETLWISIYTIKYRTSSFSTSHLTHEINY